MTEQHIPKDTVVVPDIQDEDREKIKLAVKAAEKSASSISKKIDKKCIICHSTAEFCLRGLPTHSYCRPCALEHFKFLNYLEKM